MSRADARRSVETGIGLVERLVAEGADLIALGEMGIGEHDGFRRDHLRADRPSTRRRDRHRHRHRPGALAAQGRSGGARRWLARTRRPDDPLGTLSEVGGFEIGALAGAIIGGAAAGMPVVLDGVIVGAAALLAVAFCPEVRAVPDRLTSVGQNLGTGWYWSSWSSSR